MVVHSRQEVEVIRLLCWTGEGLQERPFVNKVILLDSFKGGEFVEQLSNCQLLIKDSASLNISVISGFGRDVSEIGAPPGFYVRRMIEWTANSPEDGIERLSRGDTNRTPLRFGVDIRSDKLVVDFMAYGKVPQHETKF